MKNLKKLTLVLLVLALICSALLSRGKSAKEAPADYNPEFYAPEATPGYKLDYNAQSEKLNDVAEPTESKGGEVSDSPSGQKLIVNVAMSFETTAYDEFTGKLNDALKAAGGYTENSSLRTNSYSGLSSATYVLRIPCDKLNAFCEGIKGEGNLLSYNETATDVSLTYADIEGRLSSLKAEQKALDAMLEKAENVSDCIQLQSRLSEVRGRIESLESQLRVLNSKISYSTVTVYLTEVTVETKPQEDLTVWQEIGKKFSESAEDAGEFLRDFFVGIVSSLPTFGTVLLTAAIILALPSAVFFIVFFSVKKKNARRAGQSEDRK